MNFPIKKNIILLFNNHLIAKESSGKFFMKLKQPLYYRKLRIADNANDIQIEERHRILEKTEDCYEVFLNEFGLTRKIIRYSTHNSKNYIYEYSNKGNLISFTYTNRRRFRIKETYDYTRHEKMLFKKRFYRDGKYLKCEEYQNNHLERITYFLAEDKYCCEYFQESRHPYKVEYFDKSGFRI